MTYRFLFGFVATIAVCILVAVLVTMFRKPQEPYSTRICHERGGEVTPLDRNGTVLCIDRDGRIIPLGVR